MGSGGNTLGKEVQGADPLAGFFDPNFRPYFITVVRGYVTWYDSFWQFQALGYLPIFSHSGIRYKNQNSPFSLSNTEFYLIEISIVSSKYFNLKVYHDS